MTDLVRREPTLMEVVQQIVNSPNAKDQVEVMKELLAMRERQEDRDAKREFAEALTMLQSEMPQVSKNSEIRVKGVLRSTYASMEDVDDVVRPLMQKYGFSFSMSETGIKDTMREFAGTLLHRAGHEKTITVHMPLDKSDFRSAVQSEGSTISYAKRQLYKAFFNIIERGADDDGTGQGLATITEEQERDLEAKLDEVQANRAAFMKYFSIESLKDLKQSDLARAVEMVERKRK